MKSKKVWHPISKEKRAAKRKAFILDYAKKHNASEKSGAQLQRFIARRARILTRGHKVQCVRGCKQIKMYPQDFPAKEHGIGLCAECFAKKNP